MAHRSKLAGMSGLMAAASMAFTPAMAPAHAAEVAPQATYGHATSFHSQFGDVGGNGISSSYEAETSEYYRYRRGWRRGWRGHRRGVRGRDVLAGVLVLGGIAAIASAANNNNRRYENRRYENRRYDDRRYDERRYDNRRDDRRNTRRSDSGSGIDSAVDRCLNEIERDVRVDSVDNASRIAQGWVVTGTLFNGSGFTCQIDNNGRISSVDYGGDLSGGPIGAADGQWSDDRYAEARADARANAREETYTPAPVQEAAQEAAQEPRVRTAANEPRPAYPGGPLPGESFED